VYEKPTKDQVAFAAGSPRVVISRCQFIFFNGKPKPLSRKRSAIIEEMLVKAAESGHTCLAVATLDPVDDMGALKDEGVELPWCLLGLLGLHDPPRDDAIENVARMITSNIKVVVTSGEHRTLAIRFAEQQLRWKVQPLKAIMEADQDMVNGVTHALSLLPDDLQTHQTDWTAHLSNYQGIVLSESSPELQFRLVRVLQDARFVVAFCGYASHHSSVLNVADVGIAMHNSSDSARAAADFIFTKEDTLDTILKAIEIVSHGASSKCALS